MPNKGNKVKISVSSDSGNRELLIMVGIFVVALVALILILPGMFQSSTGEDILDVQVSAIDYSGGNVPSNPAECLARYGIDANKVVFIYSDTCIYSNQMSPLVQQLENKGYKFLWVNTNNATLMQIVDTCAKAAKFEGTPEFVCPANSQSINGILAINDLENFAINCK